MGELDARVQGVLVVTGLAVAGSAFEGHDVLVASAAITLTNPTKEGYTFTGWSGTGLTGDNNMTVTIPANSTGDRSYTAH